MISLPTNINNLPSLANQLNVQENSVMPNVSTADDISSKLSNVAPKIGMVDRTNLTAIPLNPSSTELTKNTTCGTLDSLIKGNTSVSLPTFTAVRGMATSAVSDVRNSVLNNLDTVALQQQSSLMNQNILNSLPVKLDTAMKAAKIDTTKIKPTSVYNDVSNNLSDMTIEQVGNGVSNKFQDANAKIIAAKDSTLATSSTALGALSTIGGSAWADASTSWEDISSMDACRLQDRISSLSNSLKGDIFNSIKESLMSQGLSLALNSIGIPPPASNMIAEAAMNNSSLLTSTLNNAGLPTSSFTDAAGNLNLCSSPIGSNLVSIQTASQVAKAVSNQVPNNASLLSTSQLPLVNGTSTGNNSITEAQEYIKQW